MGSKSKVLTVEEIKALQDMAQQAREEAKDAARKQILAEEKQKKAEEKQQQMIEKQAQREAKKEARKAEILEEIKKENEQKAAVKERIKNPNDEPPITNSLFSNKNNKATCNEMAHTVHEKLKWYRLGNEMGKVADDDDLENRILTFWQLCEESGEIPQKTDFYVFLGIARPTFDRWRKGDGCSRRRMELAQMFDEMYNSVKDTIADKGLINTISYIWQSKQHQGYREPKQELEVTNHNPMSMFPDSTAIEAKYSDLLTGGEE